MFHNLFLFPKILPYIRWWKNIVEPGRPQITIGRMRIARWIHKAINTHTEYVIVIDFPLQQWLGAGGGAFG
jgi:hypothetical protein